MFLGNDYAIYITKTNKPNQGFFYVYFVFKKNVKKTIHQTSIIIYLYIRGKKKVITNKKQKKKKKSRNMTHYFG